MTADAPDLSAASDATLVIAISRYREDALAEIYRRHAGSVFGLARRLLADRGDAEEVLQEVFVRLWERPERFDPARGSLRAFLLAQCHTRAIDRLRSDTARRRREENDVRRAAESGYDVEHEVWDLTVAEHVRAAVEQLPATERMPIELAYFGGHTYREVAQLLSQPEGTIKGRIRSGMLRLRDSLVDANAVGRNRGS